MIYNIGDIVEFKYSPGVKLTIIEIDDAPLCYLLSDGTWAFDSHLTLIEAYKSEDRNNIPIIIIACVVVYLFIKG